MHSVEHLEDLLIGKLDKSACQTSVLKAQDAYDYHKDSEDLDNNSGGFCRSVE